MKDAEDIPFLEKVATYATLAFDREQAAKTADAIRAATAK
jgi:hypothetical protein